MRDPSYFITAPEAAKLVRDALAAGKSDLAIRRVTEAIARLIESNGQNLPDDEFAEPGTTDDLKFDAVLATAFLYACNLCRIEPHAWMQVAPLEREWLWGDDGFDASSEYLDFIRRQTPTEFLERNILTRPRDWVNA
jgi:hypothetical protein